jgi:hypothetical protein
MPGKATQSHFKATTRPPQGHILGIDSGVQSHTKATPRPHQSHTKAPPRLHQGHPKATPKPPQSHLKASHKAGARQSPVCPGLSIIHSVRACAKEPQRREEPNFNAETQRARRNAEEKISFFLLSLRFSANLCVSALILCSVRTARLRTGSRRPTAPASCSSLPKNIAAGRLPTNLVGQSPIGLVPASETDRREPCPGGTNWQ